MMRTEVEMVAEETRSLVAEISLVHVGPRWCDSQPAPVYQVPLMWYLDQALTPVWWVCLQSCCSSGWYVAACSEEIVTAFAP